MRSLVLNGEASAPINHRHDTAGGTTCLYHFTDPRNLPSIRKYGLLSWKRLLSRRIDHYPASNALSRELDDRHNLGDYVRLCVRREHPMASRAVFERRIIDFVWLEVNIAVIRWGSTRFSNDNAASNRALVNSDPKTAMESSSNQAEVLVCGGLGVRWITFPSESIQENWVSVRHELA